MTQAAADFSEERVTPSSAREGARALRLLAQLNRVDGYRNRLVGTVAHELRNPLTAILGHLDLLREGQMSAAESDEVLELITRSAERMEGVLDDLLVLARAGELLAPGVRGRVVLGGVVAECVTLLEPAAAQWGLRMVVDLGSEELSVNGDHGQLLRMVQNLLSNAIKYSKPGGDIEIDLRRAAGAVALRITDYGIGISAEDQDHLFSEFFRSADPEVRERPGTGLGLAIVDRIVQAHGGAIGFESEPGQFTSVTVTLPILT